MHTDALGGETQFEYTHFDMVAARTTPDGARHEFTHDTELRLVGVTNPQGLSKRSACVPDVSPLADLRPTARRQSRFAGRNGWCVQGLRLREAAALTRT
ncbi:hypothetical protein ABT034_12130 [Streptomyces sp. NPDC002773]|uniref:hypothetical protein n=1 Tax=Streptomyces sp. NPDC002773 TaxID=3154430 RepID=UPI00332C8C8C